MTLGEKIRAAREQRELNLNQAAKLAGIFRTTLRQLEADEQELGNIRLTTAAAIVDLLAPAVELADFLGSYPLANVRIVTKLRRKAER
jgi:transcriptional regulator with XRE-family HTH domain